MKFFSSESALIAHCSSLITSWSLIAFHFLA
jgi:hypothetical protein